MMDRNIQNNIRYNLLQYIDKIPGIRYRELLRLTGVSNGVLAYHLESLERSSLIRADRRSRMTRFYTINIPTEEFDAIRSLKHPTARQIIKFLLENESCGFKELVEHTKKAPSTISWNLKRLADSGLILVQHGEYRLADSVMIRDVMSKYKQSFMDKVVDNYIEMTDEL